MTNSIRPDVTASPRPKGEAPKQPRCRSEIAAQRALKPLTLIGRDKAMSGMHQVVGDGMPGRRREVTGETHSVEVTGVGVRASIVVLKRGNSRGAKGGRKVDVP